MNFAHFQALLKFDGAYFQHLMSTQITSQCKLRLSECEAFRSYQYAVQNSNSQMIEYENNN